MTNQIGRRLNGFTMCLALLFFLLSSEHELYGDEGTLIEETMFFAALEGNLLGDAPEKRVLVYLPSSYENSNKRYPSVYLLHGDGGVGLWLGETYLPNFSIKDVLDRNMVVDGTLKEMIVVMPDYTSSFSGVWTVNNPVFGNYEDYLARELVQYIDQNYRTLAQVESRGIAGHSLGGYGAIYLAMRNPDVFSTVYGHESTALEMTRFPPFDLSHPCCGGLRETATSVFVSDEWNEYRIKKNIVPSFFMAAGAAFSPNPDNPPFYMDWPWKEGDNGLELVDEVWQKWVSFGPTAMVPEYRDKLSQLRAIKIDGGTGPQTNINEAISFSDALNAEGIDHELETFDGDHNNRTAQRIEEIILPYFSQILVEERESTVVEKIGWANVKSLGEIK